MENLVWPNIGLIVGALSWLKYMRAGLEGLSFKSCVSYSDKTQQQYWT